MALGEYVSVSSQRDTERCSAGQGAHRAGATSRPRSSKSSLRFYVAKGASPETAHRLAEELTAKDAFAAHVDVELGIDPDALTDPWHAASLLGHRFHRRIYPAAARHGVVRPGSCGSRSPSRRC